MQGSQLDEFRTRVERMQLINDGPKSKRVLKYVGYDNAVKSSKFKKTGFKIWNGFRLLLILYIGFTFFKATYIHNSDPNEFALTLAKLESGNGISQFAAKMMTPNYFTKPVGELVANVVSKIEELR